MATESKAIELGTTCPEFNLPSVDGHNYRLSDFKASKGLLVAFICNHCPYVKAIEGRLIALAKYFSKDDLQVVGICSNDPVSYPEDSAPELFKTWQFKNYGFPYLVDEKQEAAKAFGAVCTPDLFLYDQARRLYYHGRLDDNWKEPANVTREELKEAVDALVSGKPAPAKQNSAIGCSIKWTQ